VTVEANENLASVSFYVEVYSVIEDPVTSATSANTPEETIDPGIFLFDPLGQGIFIGLDLVGAFNIIPGLPDFRSVHDRDRRPQHDHSGENRAQSGAPPH
jgi:hypothetical protein